MRCRTTSRVPNIVGLPTARGKTVCESVGLPLAPGGTLIFSHFSHFHIFIRRLGLFFGVQNSEFQYFLGFSEI